MLSGTLSPSPLGSLALITSLAPLGKQKGKKWKWAHVWSASAPGVSLSHGRSPIPVGYAPPLPPRWEEVPWSICASSASVVLIPVWASEPPPGEFLSLFICLLFYYYPSQFNHTFGGVGLVAKGLYASQMLLMYREVWGLQIHVFSIPSIF